MAPLDKNISVVIPVRGKLHLLPRALNSCFVQTLKPHEIILIDDNSNDADKKEVKRIAIEFESILTASRMPSSFILKESMGEGVSSARNLGVKHATGSYIAFLDADDFFLPDKLEIQVLAMLEADSDMSHTNYLIKGQDTGISRIANTGFNQGYRQDSVISFRDCGIATPTVMFKKSLIKDEVDIFPEGIHHGEDLIAWAFLCSISTKPLLHINQALTVVEVNEESNSSSPIKTNSAKTELAKYAQIRDFAPLKFHEFGGLKVLFIQLLPFSKRAINYLLNLTRALKGK